MFYEQKKFQYIPLEYIGTKYIGLKNIPSKNSKIRNMKSKFLDITKNMFQQIYIMCVSPCLQTKLCELCSNSKNIWISVWYSIKNDLRRASVPSFDDSVSFCERQWGVFGRDGETPASPASTSPSTTDAKPRWRTNDPGGSELSSVQLIGAGSQSITANTAQTLVYINPPKSGPILSTWIIQPVCKVPVASIIHANT